MPSDKVLYTFDKKPAAAEALFWARSHNWEFSDWRECDCNKLDAEGLEDLQSAMADSSCVDDVDIKLCMDKYYSRMNPTIPCIGIDYGVCVMVDIHSHC
jgi:hypothetical protein